MIILDQHSLYHIQWYVVIPKVLIVESSYMNFLAPVSIGECVDKLTILDIKCEKIIDKTKLANVRTEYNALYELLTHYFSNKDFKYHYSILKLVNTKIWDDMDILRTLDRITDQPRWVEACYATILDNDRRFRIKHKINALLNSSLKEQKGYAPRSAFVLTHLGLGDMITAIGMVRYLSTSYDSVTVVCKAAHAHNVRMFYGDDPTIQLHIVDNEFIIHPSLGVSPEEFNKLTADHTPIIVGQHRLAIGLPTNNFTSLPYNFYADVGISPTVFWTYFHTASHPESSILYQSIPVGIPYIIIHSGTSTGPVFTIEQIEKQSGINRNTTLLLDVNTNVYISGHPFYAIAETFVNKPLATYKDTIIHAASLIVTDSSFFCFAMQLPIESPYCYVVSRDNRDYSYMYEPKTGFDPACGKQKFKQITF